MNGITFTDWDELHGIRLQLLNSSYKNEDIHKKLHCGLSKDTKITMQKGTCKSLIDVNIGDILWNNIKVVGIVEINGLTINQMYEYEISDKINPDLGKMRIICSDNLYYFDNVGNITCVKKEIAKETKLYHLLTNTSYFYIQKLKVSDFNSCIDMEI